MHTSQRANGAAVAVRGSLGAQLEMTQRLTRAGRLVRRFDHGDAARENTFAPSGDDGTLWLSARITADRLPRDVEYRLRRRRASPHDRRAAR